MLAIVVVAALVGGGMALWGGDGETVRSERLPGGTTAAVPDEEATTVAPATTAATTGSPATTRPPTTAAPATTAAPRRLADSRLSLDGIGPVDIGMTPDEASAAAGTTIRILPGPGPDPAGECVYGRADGGPPGLSFMFIRGRIARVDVGGPDASSIRTVSGMGVGNTEAEVQRTYPGRITVSVHPYLPTGHYLTYTPADPALSHLSMIFETDGERVTRFRAGLRGAVSQIEGCS